MKDCDDPVGGLDGTPGKGGESGKVVTGRGTIAASEHVEVVSSTGGDEYLLATFGVYLRPELTSATFPGNIVGSSGGPIGSGSPGGSGGSVLPPIFIPVANTTEYTISANNYTPPGAYHINETGPGNAGEVNYAAFAEKMKADALALANNLTALRAEKLAQIAAGPDGPECDIDVDYPANTFTIEVKSKFQVIPCEDPVPCEFTCSTFTVTGDDTVTITNGTITLTMDGGNLTIAGATAVNVADGQLQEGGVRVATRGWVTDNFSENNHTHTFSGSGSDGNTSITISGTTSGPST
jgi:hypothetical protein